MNDQFDHNECRYCGNDTTQCPLTDIFTCISCGRTFTKSSWWEQYCTECGFYINACGSGCKEGCVQMAPLDPVPAFLE